MEVFQSTVPLKLYITDYMIYRLKTRWFFSVLENTRNKNYSTHMNDRLLLQKILKKMDVRV
jgi:hypothetical protein